ncbi:unnamed protein product [Miscanthus lutarioriparius]|uniref:Uncharacterized protein n=1 Tax=Miscanthus lutarioriparius TaxID=422564 RepID=A0A811QL93_9POAL|nr:unnamed protein product [Miscanthus lutarioriparius]
MASRSVTGTAVLCFLVVSLLLASSSFVAGTGTEAAADYGAGRKMKQTAAGAVAPGNDEAGYLRLRLP